MSTVYVVKPKDNLSAIAKAHGVTLGELLVANPQFTRNGRNPNLIYPGESVSIPSKSKFDANLNLKQGSQDCSQCPTCTLVHAAANPGCTWRAPSGTVPAVIAVGRSERLLANISPAAKSNRVTFRSLNASVVSVKPVTAGSASQFLTIAAAAPGDTAILAECNGKPLASYPMRAVRFQPPLLVAWSDRRPGFNADGSVADDMKYGDYTATQIKAIDWKFNWLELGEMSTSKPGPHFTNLRIMATTLFSSGDLEENIKKMIDHFEASTGTDYSNSVLTDAVQRHASTNRFVEQIRKELNRALTKARGELNVLAAPGQVTLTGRPYFSEIGDTLSGLTIAINDTWAYEVYVDEYALEGGCWHGKFRLVLWDHFGLNEPDVDASKPYGTLAGFRSWFILQHLDRFAYRPFKTKVELPGYSFEGGL